MVCLDTPLLAVKLLKAVHVYRPLSAALAFLIYKCVINDGVDIVLTVVPFNFHIQVGWGFVVLTDEHVRFTDEPRKTSFELDALTLGGPGVQECEQVDWQKPILTKIWHVGAKKSSTGAEGEITIQCLAQQEPGDSE